MLFITCSDSISFSDIYYMIKLSVVEQIVQDNEGERSAHSVECSISFIVGQDDVLCRGRRLYR